MQLIDERLAVCLMPQLDSEANKYTRGTCELVVGDSTYPGAGVLAAAAATRMGAGYIKVYTSDEAACALRVLHPSAVASAFNQYEVDHCAQDNHHLHATVVGCGLCDTEENTRLVTGVIAAAASPLLLDGGALTVLASKEGFAALKAHHAAGFSAIITPHGGEAARLLAALSSFEKEESLSTVNRSQCAEAAYDALQLASAYNAVCVLKGPKTYIATPQDALDNVRVFEGGSPALAKAGTGDVLAGCIGALLAQGLCAADAAALGVFVHGRAGVLAASEIGAFGVTTEDVVRMLPRATRTLMG